MFRTLFLVVFLMMNSFDSCGDTAPTRSSVNYSAPNIHGYIIDANTGQYIDSAKVCLQKEFMRDCDNTVTDHKYSINYSSSGHHTLIATCDGYAKKTLAVELPGRSSSRVDIQMTPLIK